MNDLPDALARLCAATRTDVAARSTTTPQSELRARAADAPPTRGFALALPGLIAELKRASPSAGPIRPDFDPAALARAYERAGAACLSVLTEPTEFLGTLDDLQAARAATALPVLRKDFTLDPWQIWESRAAGADCILLIIAALEPAQAADLAALARSLTLDVLVEIHHESELPAALACDTAALIGINNRDLRTLRTDLAVTARLAPLIPPGRRIVSESGIRTHADLLEVARHGADSVLVGESLLRQPDLEAATRALLGHP